MNPFKFGQIVTGDNFYDRVVECDRLVKTLSGANNIVLYAPRRFGKTSLVFKVMDELEKQKFICIYLDFSMVFSKESFIENYSKAILKKQINLQKAVINISKFVKGFIPVLKFNDSGKPEFSIEFKEQKLSNSTLEEVIDLPEKLAGSNHRYIVVFDEFQEITKLNGENFENLLRSKIQRQPNVNYLFLGSRTHLLQDMFSNKSRAFYNSAMTMQLNKLPLEESVKFLIKKFRNYNIKINKKNAEYLVGQADNIPYYIQLIAAEIWQYLVLKQTDIDKEIIDICSGNIIDLKSDYYYSLFDGQSAYQKKMLKAIAVNGKNIYSTEYRVQFRLSATSTTQKAVNGLVESGIIEKNYDEYIIGDPFFRKYIQDYAI